MVRKNFLIAGVAAALFAVPPANAQQGAPKVRLGTLPVTTVGRIEPTASLSEPAYLFALAIDNSGQVQVLSPALPSDAILFEAAKSIHFPEFYTGLSTASSYGDYGSRYRQSSLSTYGDFGASNGTVMVLASRTPFNFAAISDGVYWNEQALRQIIKFRNPSQAVAALGRALTEKGQQFGQDYVNFGRSGYQQFASSSFRADNACGIDYSFSPYGYSSSYYGYSGLSYNGLFVSGNTSMGGVVLVRVGTDGCGRPRYMLVPAQTLPPRDSAKMDSVATKQSRSVVAGVYQGEEARRVFESLARNGNSSDTYVGLRVSPVYNEKEDRTTGRPVIREATPDRVESFERVRAEAPRPIDRAPVIRDAPASYSQPVTRAEPVQREPVQREPKVEVVSRVKDN